MGKKTFISYVFFICVAMFSDMYGYIYHISVMKRESDSLSNGSQIVIGLGDYHDKDHPVNSEQRAYLEALLKKCRSLKSKLIVEDLSSVNSDGKGMCCNFAISPRGGVLGKLADKARAEFVDVDNVEYRFCRVVGIGPLLNNLQDQPKKFASALSLKVAMLCQEFLDELGRINHYNDGSTITHLYKKISADVHKVFNQFKFDKVKNLSIAEYCSRFFKNNYVKNLEKLCIFDSPLIDLKITHSIVSSPDKSLVIIAAGGSHIEKVNSLLELVGYKKVTMPLIDFHYKQSVGNSLGSGDTKAGRTGRPPAINLKILDQFFD